MSPSGAPGLSRSTDDVVAWLLGAGHLSCVDEDGHPLGEQASPLYARSAQEVRRRFGDARDAACLPCNGGALAALRAAWPFILETVGALEASSPPTMRRALRRAEAGRSLALLVALRAPERAVPRELAALYKATLGFGEVFASALLEGRVDADDPPATEAQLFAWLDERPWLIGERQVCAGSRAQLRALHRALATGESATRSRWTDPWIEPALSALEELHALAAAAAGAARPHVLAGRVGAEVAACEHLFVAREVPRLVDALRGILDAGPLHPTLLFASDAVPASLRTFIDALPSAASTARPLDAIDTALRLSAAPVAERLMTALDRCPTPLTLDALRA